MTRIGDNGAMYVALLPTFELSRMIQNTILENRELTEIEEQTNKQYAELTKQFCSLRDKTTDLKEQIGKIEDTEANDDRAKLPKLRQKLKLVEKEQEVIDKTRTAITRVIDSERREQRENVHGLIEALDKVYVAGQFLEEPEENEKSEAGLTVSESQGEKVEHQDDTSDPDSRTGDPAAAQKILHQELHNQYRCARLQLHYSEWGLDERLEVFDREAEQRREDIQAGRPVPPQIEVDMRQFEYTQRRTRDIIKAEAEFEEAKAAAFTAGVKLSQATTGNPDRPDDGYRLSPDEQMAAMNPMPIQSWVEALSEPDIMLMEDSLALEDSLSQTETERSSAPTAGVEMDHWDAKSIDLCDSWSLVADGPWRRRIDTWRTKCGLR